ncbi:MAG: hypothetical protein OM95_02625 [Bdellovibrio sp. ArHS]|uniref:type IV pilus modification PilV family protein n=1 Tax=Bdellovibrio sp. ArHS TaxID=1569284 RepID=UPI00058324A0|nr:prepilin-type N-terminal cleavage/methylation domain-containing protein [Bdellovibrio sp. ArHS]KHD89636.1 MAG: hypothetical protein OM95_02625 [Bdellovibrio sp. ArHS]
MKTWNNKGQTLVEALVGFALLTIVGTAFVGGMAQLRKTTAQTVQLSSSDKQINDIAENIKAGVENYQVNFNYEEGTSGVLALDKLPMAWDSGRVARREDCKECAGTYGYTIQPYEEFRGLYKVTLRMTHKSWTDPYRDYVFVVSAK